ncbi:diguanylate cyclase domain-containing protein [Eisenbergiella porci]|uniref:diguanylate cyclase domain-containing protein n=1 Tax=Eisenbergiella porci TaxID=2652274 RepID=UPI002A8417E7|nr:diguanylate cyclase [Eisenbergiella porci]
MRSIQTKLIAMILSCILLSTFVIGGAGLLNSSLIVDENSEHIMELLSRGNAQDINALLSRIEQSVNTLADYASDQISSLSVLKTDSDYVEEYTQQLLSAALNAANNTEGALAVYVRYNPRYTSPTSGLFWSRTTSTGTFQKLPPTDLSKYSPDDTEHVGWYYIPVKNGEATWMEPYFNRNINVEIISYVVPLFLEHEIVGIVGMDIDFGVIRSIVEKVQVYKSGFAFLTDNQGHILYHKAFPRGTLLSSIDPSLEAGFLKGTGSNSLLSYEWQGRKNLTSFCVISDNMRLAVTAPASEINAAKNRLCIQMGISCLLIAALFVSVAVLVARRMSRPLRELTSAAKKIADGDLSISLTCKTRDEVGVLTESFRTTVQQLQKYIDYINGLAYRDGLTGVKNKTAYQEAVKRLEEQIRTGLPAFAVVVLDLNGLKVVNDTYGHDFGDMLIIDASRLICKSFSHSPVFRIGGDEFVVLLEGGDYDQYSRLLELFEQTVNEYNRTAMPGSHISIARGIAVFGSETDLTFADVFKRADNAMYQNKAAIKRGAAVRLSEPLQRQDSEKQEGSEEVGSCGI